MSEVRVRSRPAASPATTAPAAPVDPVRSRQRQRAPVAIETPTRTESVEVEHKVSGETLEHVSDTTHTPVPFDGPHATVHVGGKATIQIVKFESISVSVGIWLPCPNTDQGKADGYAEASNWVEEKIRRELALARGEIEA